MRNLGFLSLVALILGILAAPLSAATVGSTTVAYSSHGALWLTGGLVVFGATLSTGALTLIDWAKRIDPDGKIAGIVELLTQMNEVLLDCLWLEGNLPTGHRSTVRTGLPTVAWRLLNAGVSPSKSTTAQLDEGVGILEGWSEVDKDLALLNGNIGEFRLSEATAFLEAMNQEFCRALFYGNHGLNPEQFTGLSPRYSDSTAGNGKNIVKGGGSGADNSSMWLILWGGQTMHGIYPKGSKAGLVHEDRGEQIVYTNTTTTNAPGQARMVALVDRFQWKPGIVLRDWRSVVRIPNIDISDLIANSGSQAALQTLMAKAVHRIPSLNMGRAAFYANRTVLEMLDIQERADIKGGGGLTYENVDGRRVLTFRGIPIRTCDQLLETEATVS